MVALIPFFEVRTSMLPLLGSAQCNGINITKKAKGKVFFSPLLAPVVIAQSSNTFLSPYSLVSRTLHTLVRSPHSFYTSMWVEPTVNLPCSRRGNHTICIASVTPNTLLLSGSGTYLTCFDM